MVGGGRRSQRTCVWGLNCSLDPPFLLFSCYELSNFHQYACHHDVPSNTEGTWNYEQKLNFSSLRLLPKCIFIKAIRKSTNIPDISSYANLIPYFLVAYLTTLSAEVWTFIPQTTLIKTSFKSILFSLCLLVESFPSIPSNSCMNINSIKGLLSEESNTMQILTK